MVVFKDLSRQLQQKVGVAADITAQKWADALRESEERLRVSLLHCLIHSINNIGT